MSLVTLKTKKSVLNSLLNLWQSGAWHHERIKSLLCEAASYKLMAKQSARHKTLKGRSSMSFVLVLTVGLLGIARNVTAQDASPPTFEVQAIFNQVEDDFVLIRVTASEPLQEISVMVTVVPVSKKNSPLKIEMEDVEKATVFEGQYPKRTGWGDIKEIQVSGTDLAGNEGQSDGTFDKILISKEEGKLEGKTARRVQEIRRILDNGDWEFGGTLTLKEFGQANHILFPRKPNIRLESTLSDGGRINLTVRFFNEQGGEIKSINYVDLFILPVYNRDHGFLGVHSREEIFTKAGSPGVSHFDFYDEAGTKLWTSDRVSSNFRIAPDGSAVCSTNPSGEGDIPSGLVFVDDNGQVVREIQTDYVESMRETTKFLIVEFTPTLSGEKRLVAYTWNGDEVARVETEDFGLNRILESTSGLVGDTIAFKGEKQRWTGPVFLFSPEDANVEKVSESGRFRGLSMSPDESFLAYSGHQEGSQDVFVKLFDLEKREFLRMDTFRKSANLEVSAHGDFILGTGISPDGTTEYDDAVLVDRAGRLRVDTKEDKALKEIRLFGLGQILVFVYEDVVIFFERN